MNKQKRDIKTKEHIEKLKSLGVFEAFERNLKSDALKSTIQEHIDYWNRKDHAPFERFVSSAFYWAETPEGLKFWAKIANS